MKPHVIAVGSAAAVAVALGVLYGHTARSTEPVANVGTLTCVASPGDKELLGPARKLSCTFEPIAGPQASFAGMAKGIGAETPDDTKIILAWAVLGPEVDAPAKQLEGRYVGAMSEEGGPNAAGLVGGKDGHFSLRPLTVELNAAENAALTVLELQLAAMKA